MSDQEREYKSAKAIDEGDEPDVEAHKKLGPMANEDDSPDTDPDDFELHKKAANT